jgi:CO/xanthine dehydrogenase Mo-binding subunit
MTTLSLVGQNVPRRDFPEKLVGQARYSADLKLPGMLYGHILRSPHPHANIVSIDTSQAEQVPGVMAVITPFNVPRRAVAPIAQDTSVLDSRVRFVGDEVAGVAAVDDDAALLALSLIKVEYEILPFYTDPDSALAPDAVDIHPGGNLAINPPLSIGRGDVDQGFAEADLVREETYNIACHSATPMEPRAAMASWEGDSVTVWKSTRGVHLDQVALAHVLDIPEENVHMIGPFLGGGFGNKDESRLAALAALLSLQAGKPVRIEFSREDEFVAGRTRHAGRVHLKVGAKRDGTITAIHGTSTLNTGAYAASGAGVARRAGQGIIYLYHCPNVRYESYLAYTNCPSAGSYRALGAPQGHFALETLMDRIAEELGIDPLEFRLKNRVPPEGQPGPRLSPPDQIVDSQPIEGGIPFSSYGLEECLTRGAEAFGWDQPLEQPADSSKRRGKGMSMMIYRGGPGSTSAATVSVAKTGEISLLTGLMDVGEGATTVLPQMTAEILGVAPEDVITVFGDSATTPEAPITAGSTATFSTGSALVRAAAEVRRQLLDLASDGLEAPVMELDIMDGRVFVTTDPSRSMALTDVASRMDGEAITEEVTIPVPGSADYIVNSFGAHFCEVEVDTDTGRVRVVRYVAAQDSGRIMNPRMALNQVEGAISQMLGFALSEELVTDGPTGVTLNASYLEHKSPTIMDYPNLEVIFADTVDPVGPMGAKGLGEVPCPGVAPAIANAVYDALGLRVTELPITPDRVIQALQSA